MLCANKLKGENKSKGVYFKKKAHDNIYLYIYIYIYNCIIFIISIV